MTTQDERSCEEYMDLAGSLLGSYETGEDLQTANEYINMAVYISPREGRAWLLKSHILSCMEDDPAALACAELALALLPASTEARYAIAAILSDLDRYDEALTMLEEAFITLDQDERWLEEDMYYLKGMILEALGQDDEALATLQQGLQRHPESSLLRGGLEPLHRERMRRSFKVIDGGRAPAGPPRP